MLNCRFNLDLNRLDIYVNVVLIFVFLLIIEFQFDVDVVHVVQLPLLISHSASNLLTNQDASVL